MEAADNKNETEVRVCQFWVRGRCARDNCEFRHDVPKKEAAAPVVAVKSTPGPPAAVSDDTLALAEESVRDSSTFIAGKDETTERPLLVRRARNGKKNAAAKEAADQNGGGSEEVLESPADKALNEKNLEENVQPPVRDSVVSADQDQDAQQPKDSFSADEVSAPTVTVPEQLLVEDKTTKAEKVSDLSKEWGDDEEEEDTTVKEGVAKETEESIESIVSFIQEGGPGQQPSTGKDKDGAAGGTTSDKSNKEWVEEIFGDDGKPVAAAKGKNSVYDLNPEGEDFSVSESTPFTAVQPKVETDSAETPTGKVKKIGNNTYIYEGGDEEGGAEMEHDAEEGEGSQDDSSIMEVQEGEAAEDESTPKKKGGGKKGAPAKRYEDGRRRHSTQYVYGARSSAAKTRRCGECEGCNREDCGKCSACVDKPKFGGRGAKKQACHYRMCAWKNPSGKRLAPGTAPSQAPPIIPPQGPPPKKGAAAAAAAMTPSRKADPATPKQERGRKSISVISPAVPKARPSDADLPDFDPDKFRPGYTPPVVKKGEEEYAIIVSGVKDTGLCGKYWSDIDNLPPRRRRTTVADAEKAKGSEEVGKKATPSSAEKKRAGRKQSLKEKVEMTDKDEDGPDEDEDEGAAEDKESADKEEEELEEEPVATTPGVVKKNGPGRKRKAGNGDNSTAVADKSPPTKKVAMETAQDKEEEQTELIKMPSKTAADVTPAAVVKTESLTKTQTNAATEPAAQDGGAANGSVSCVADSTQREVVVECFAPYDDHRWVNIGKERDGMAPDAVQYARALRPPYHLLSFLRIKGHSTKGMSCTDKNTMVFVVLEGEITVVLHTTQFNAKKGDSFYIPPKNYYNLINNKAREAELSLIQFQYDGPLPTVNAASQSGTTPAGQKPVASGSSQPPAN